MDTEEDISYDLKEMLWKAAGFDTIYMVKMDYPDHPTEGERVGIVAAKKENLVEAVGNFIENVETEFDGQVRVVYLYPIGKLEPKPEEQ